MLTKNMYKVRVREYEHMTGQPAKRVINGRSRETEEFKKWLKDKYNVNI